MTAFVAAYGAYELTRLPLDALPDITNKQVMINYAAPALGPEDVEKRITFPIETAIAGLAGIESTRSFSRNGYGQVTAIFREDTNLYFMRQQVAERLAQARPNLPPGVEPQLGPVSTGLGEIFMYSVEYAAPGGDGARVSDGEPGWQGDGSYLTDDGERLTDEIARLAYLQDRARLDCETAVEDGFRRSRHRLARRVRKAIRRRAGCNRAGAFRTFLFGYREGLASRQSRRRRELHSA